MKLYVGLYFLFSLTLANAGLLNGGRPYKMCEIQLAKYINGSQFTTEFGAHRYNFWYGDFNAKSMLATFKSETEIASALTMLEGMLNRDEIFNINLKRFVEEAVFQKKITPVQVRDIFKNQKVNSTIISFSKNPQNLKKLSKEEFAKLSRDEKRVFRVHFKVTNHPGAIKAYNKLIAKSKLSPFYKKEYRRILFAQEFSPEEFETLSKMLILKNDLKELKLIEEYLVFIQHRSPKYRKKALLAIPGILNKKKVVGRFGKVDSTPAEDFIRFERKIKKYEEKEVWKFKNKYQKDNDGRLTNALKDRAFREAKNKSNIYKTLLAGCKANQKTESLKGAFKKFKNFKIATGIGFGIGGYWESNSDKLDPESGWYKVFDAFFSKLAMKGTKNTNGNLDTFWIERLGYELTSGLVFTAVGNGIMTQASTSFLYKTLVGYLIFSGVDAVNAGIYGKLFGKDKKALEKEFEALKKDPNFQKKLKKLLAEIKNKTADTELKKIFDEHFNFSASASVNQQDLERITIKDLGSEEAKEMVLELLAERMYLNNMGKVPWLQSGSTGVDRWAFYRGLNLPRSFKSVAVNLLILRVMCLAPKIGTAQATTLALLIELADKRLTTPIVYDIRREGINQ